MTLVSYYRSALRVLVTMSLVAIAFVQSGCDYSLVEEPVLIPALKISITPQTAEMQKGTALNLSAVISGYKSNGNVTWEFVGTPAGDLKANGLTAVYSAPVTITTSPMIVSIRVRSVEDTARYATSVLTILDSTGGSNNGNQIALSVGPSAATIEAGQTLQFTATVTGTTNTGVTWRVATGMGTISSTGLYAVPANAPAHTAVIEATSAADPSVKATANVNIRVPVDPDLVCFNPTIKDIFASNCLGAGCHNSQDRADGFDFSTYEGIKAGTVSDHDGDDDDASGSEIVEALRETDPRKRMPRNAPPLSEEKIQLIEKWISQGAQNIDCSDPGTGNDCDTLNMSFTLHINPIIDAKCAGCHSGSNPPRGINLTTYTGIKSAAQSGQLSGAITHSLGYIPMPMNAAKLDDCSIAKIKAWINAGTPNN